MDLDKRPEQSPRELGQESQQVQQEGQPGDFTEGKYLSSKFPDPHLFPWLFSCSLESSRRQEGTVARLGECRGEGEK